MRVSDYVRAQVAGALRLGDSAMKDVTEEQFNWLPPGTANPVRATFLHMISTEDNFVQALIQGKPRTWDLGGWCDRIGVYTLPERGRGWEEAQARHVPLAAALEYQRAVRAATNAYLAGLTDEELDRMVDSFSGPGPTAEILALLVIHTANHAGDIASVRGMQGAKGLPF